MRTITKNLKKRLQAQVHEANFQGFDKIASQLEDQIQNTPVREDFEEYIYSHHDLENDVQNLLWTAATRTQDYFGKTADAKALGALVVSLASDLISAVRTEVHGDVIGPYEPSVPGERRLVVEIDADGE